MGSDRLLISSRAFAELSIFGEEQPIVVERGATYTAVLHLKGRRPAYSYWELIGDPHLKRVRNVGLLAQPTPRPDEILLCVQYRCPPITGSLEDYLMSHLSRLGIVETGVKVLGMHRSDLEFSTLTDRTLVQLSSTSKGQVLTTRSTDFGEGFVAALKEWF